MRLPLFAVSDVLCRRVADLFSGPLAAGETQRFTLDAAALPDGSYVVRAAGATFEVTRTITLVR